MEKIYGYKEKDIIGLANFIKERQNQTLSKIFESYSLISGKAKGTIRNLYYELAKKSIEDKEFCQKYLNGKQIRVSSIKEFNKQEEKQLIKDILIAKTKGKSVRSTIIELSNGDSKLGLRLQNKYRNALKNNQKLIEEITLQLKNEGYDLENINKNKQSVISEEHFEKLKSEINNLVSRLLNSERKENEFLKEKITLLERENLRLYKEIYSQKTNKNAMGYFNQTEEKNNLLN